jgi:uroporphyrinogen-III decarboxylase
MPVPLRYTPRKTTLETLTIPPAERKDIEMNMDQLYNERLNRYVTAMRNEKPDKIPIRPFVAEFTAGYAGFTCQEVTHDFNKAFIAARKCAADFDWDAVVANMVYVWTGLTQAVGLKYYAVPGIDLPPDTPFQYKEPGEEDAFMKADEYDQLIDDPTAFLYNVWLPRVSSDISPPSLGRSPSLGRDLKSLPNEGPIGHMASYRNNLALVKGAMAMLSYFMAFGPQCELLRAKSGTVSAIAGILKAPFDILADKLRGYIGLTMDMATQPEKVLEACEALMPHLCHVALTTADPNKQVPVGFWMHRGCVPFVSPAQFESHYWPTIKPIIEELWRNGHQTLFYAEGDWNRHLESFAELPDASIVYHVDRGDIFEVHRKIGHKFCLSGGIPNFILAYRTPDEVREYAKKVIDGVARDGGYIMDASAIMQTDTTVENLRALTDFTRDYGTYSQGTSAISDCGFRISDLQPDSAIHNPQSPMDSQSQIRNPKSAIKPGVCLPWEEKVKELGEITGDADLVRTVWESIDSLGAMFIWQVLLSF